jgi:polyisoprenoid-binding protein YceI
MKKVHLITLALSLGIAFTSCNNEKKSSGAMDSTKDAELSTDQTAMAIDLEKSTVKWTGSLVGVYNHYGTLDFKSGSISIKDGKINEGVFVIDMKTMKPADENYNPDEGSTKEKLIQHLSSADFFDVENYPEASFTIKKHENNTITGDLTIRGKTNEEVVKNVQIKKENGKKVFYGTMTFNRHKYDVTWKHPMKDKVLSDDIELKIKLVE